ASTVSIGRVARFRPPPSCEPSIVSRWPLPVSALNAMPFAASQSIVHSMVALRYCSAAKNRLHWFSVDPVLRSECVRGADRADCLLHLLHWWIQPKAATPWAFFWARRGPGGRCVGRVAAYDALPQ